MSGHTHFASTALALEIAATLGCPAHEAHLAGQLAVRLRDGTVPPEDSLAVRIAVVANAFCRVVGTADEPRAGARITNAVAELARHAGRRYDPAVIRALIAVLAPMPTFSVH